MQIWPRIAEWFGMPVGEPMQIPLNEYMRDKGADWDKIVEKYGLNKDFEWGSLGTWTFAVSLQPRHEESLVGLSKTSATA